MTGQYATSELYHWGIKGMKWGVRRYQNVDGTLTAAGKKRYSDAELSSKNTTNGKTGNVKRYDKLYSKYKAEGYSDKESERLTNGQIKTERVLATIGTIAIVSLTAYGAYKYYDNNIDRSISSKHIMQTVHKDSIGDRLKPGNPFYATYTKKDHTIYASKVFSHFRDGSKVTRFYTDDGIKVASRGTGRKIFNDLMKNNPEMNQFVKSDKLLSKHVSNPKKLYDQFNKHLVLRGEDNDRIHNMFYDALRSRGYGAVIDVNDSKLEGFTYNPVIVFDKQMKHITSSTAATPEELGVKRMAKAAGLSSLRKMLNNPLSHPDVAQLAVVGTASSVASAVGANNYVKTYKKRHPNTNLTDWQISTMYLNSNVNK